MNLDYLSFEQPIAELEAKIEELQLVGNDNDLNIAEEVVIGISEMIVPLLEELLVLKGCQLW